MVGVGVSAFKSEQVTVFGEVTVTLTVEVLPLLMMFGVAVTVIDGAISQLVNKLEN